MSFNFRSFLAGTLLAVSPIVAGEEPIVKRARFDAEAVIIKGTWSCTPEQILTIDQAVVDAHEFANEALTALKNPNVLSSPAYYNWFGSDAGDGPSVATLRDRHYQVVIDSLKPPSVETAFRFKPEPFFPPNTVTENSLVFGCSGATGPCADGAMVAGVNSATESQPAVFGTTMLLLCETFFDTTRASNKKMIENWRAEGSNYAIFALDVTAFPITNEQPNACQAPARPSTLAKVRRQISFSNSTMSSRPPSSSSSATRTPIPPVLTSSASQPPASRISSARPSSSAEVIEISGAVAVIIPAGAVAFGGPGGGLANFGGVIVPVPEGQTVSDPSKDPKPSGDAPSTTPRQPSTTSSAPATSSSCAPPAQKSYGPAVEKVCEDWSGMNQTAFLGLMEAVPVVDWEGAPVVSMTSILETVEPSPTSLVEVITTVAPAPPTTTSAEPTVAPVACYNFDINAYGYCCPEPGNPCENDIGKCYFNGEGVSGGASGIVPDGARCPPPPGAEYCRGPCEE
ncbi:hypothetical protein CGCSCA4_v005343 [Colletotrichum siamense]|uniref:Uncharacterized protein n=1 Tax=Colletotrichum siamense TaxID=690259 RepID=A0A9P5EW57_COLSI|nr:hypothetical protein CGCSCA4_v005343 [Colletotrichum siamense]KAF4861304.1 hypothetical protein CGCSCA2_v004805 [Colletotrichum siamense]